MGDTIPITPPTGFLGAGRTTLLDCLPDRPGLADAAVVIDGFGGVGLDHSPVETPCDEGVLASAGCLYCTVPEHHRCVRGDFRRTLTPGWRGTVQCGLCDHPTSLRRYACIMLFSRSRVVPN